MKNQLEDKLIVALTPILSDGFNRSISALEEAGALDLQEMRTAYQGIGSTYYDAVTAALEHTVEHARPVLREIIDSTINE